MFNKKKLFSLVTLVCLTSSCGFFQSSQSLESSSAEPNYSDSQPLRLKVNRINIVSEFSPSFRRPNVEHLFPTNIERTAREWARDNLEATDPGSDKTATFIIKDASVIESQEPAQRAFQKDRIKYRANLNVILRITDEKNLSRAETEIKAWRELTIPVDTPLRTREDHWNSMTEKLFAEFGPRMTENINKYLNIYVKNNNSISEY